MSFTTRFVTAKDMGVLPRVVLQNPIVRRDFPDNHPH